jgi:hypothetical protein
MASILAEMRRRNEDRATKSKSRNQIQTKTGDTPVFAFLPRRSRQRNAGRAALLRRTPNAWLGRDADAKVAAANFLKLMPGYTVQSLIEVGKKVSDNPVYNQQIGRMAEALRRAGLPRGDKNTN